MIGLTNLLERGLEEIAERDALADMQITERVEMDTPRLTQIFVRALIETLPGMPGRTRRQLDGCPPAIHDARDPLRELANTCFCRIFRLCHPDDIGRDAQPFSGHDRILRTIAQPFPAMIQVTAEGQVLDAAGQRAQPLLGILDGIGPVPIRHYTDLKPRFGRQPHPAYQQGIIQERLTALEKNPFDRAKLPGLREDLFDLCDRQRPFLPGAAPNKTMVALEGALVGEKDMETRNPHNILLDTFSVQNVEEDVTGQTS